MSRLDKVKAVNLRAKKIRNTPTVDINSDQWRERMDRHYTKEWRQASASRPVYFVLDELVTRWGLMVAVLAALCARVEQPQP